MLELDFPAKRMLSKRFADDVVSIDGRPAVEGKLGEAQADQLHDSRVIEHQQLRLHNLHYDAAAAIDQAAFLSADAG